MSETTAIRTLVKSAPELWAACSDRESLARHLGAFGEIRITRLEPETTVAWEGERASGTVTIEPSGWGTKVTMTATLADGIEEHPVAEPEPSAEPEPRAEPAPRAEPERVAEAEPAAAVQPVGSTPTTETRRRGILARLTALFARERPEPAMGTEPEPEAEPEVSAVVAPEPKPEPEPEPEPEPYADTDPKSALGAALDSLGQAHHRPFSQL